VVLVLLRSETSDFNRPSVLNATELKKMSYLCCLWVYVPVIICVHACVCVCVCVCLGASISTFENKQVSKNSKANINEIGENTTPYILMFQNQ